MDETEFLKGEGRSSEMLDGKDIEDEYEDDVERLKKMRKKNVEQLQNIRRMEKELEKSITRVEAQLDFIEYRRKKKEASPDADDAGDDLGCQGNG